MKLDEVMINAYAAGHRRENRSQMSGLTNEQTNPYDELIHIFDETEKQEFFSVLEERFDSSAIVDFLQAMRYAINFSSLEKEEKKDFRFKFLKTALGLFGRHLHQPNTAQKIISSLSPETDLTPDERSDLCAHILENLLENNACYQGCLFLPQLLCPLPQSAVPFAIDGDETETLTPSQFQALVLDRFFNLDWCPPMVVPISEMLRELPLTDALLSKVVHKVFSLWEDLQMQELPSALHNMLLLASKGCKALILDSIVSFFGHLADRLESEKAGKRVLLEARQIEGTAILQINFATKQDQTIGKQYFSFLKRTNPSLSPFLVALLLSLARISAFHTPAFDVLKASISSSYQVVNPSRTFKFSFKENRVEKTNFAFKSIIQGSAFGWDHILPSLIDLGFSLLETNTRTTDHNSPNQTSKLGQNILLQTFRAHYEVQNEILNQIISRVLTNAEYVNRHIDLLRKIISEVPQDVRARCAQVKEALDYLPQLSHRTAISLIHAVLPLVCLDSDFQGYVMLVLRKSIFNSQLNTRFSATEGFLSILNALCFHKEGGSTSSLSQSSVTTDHGAVHESTFLEIFGILRRSTTQQAEIRKHLYHRLASLCHHLPLSVTPALFALLTSQIEKYISSETPFVDIFSAVDGARFLAGNLTNRQIEPLGDLIQSIAQTISSLPPEITSEETETKPTHVRLQEKFSELAISLQDTPLSDFFRESETYNVEAAFMLKDLYVGLIEYAVLFREKLANPQGVIFALFEKYRELSEGLGDKSPSTQQNLQSQSQSARGRKGKQAKSSSHSFGLVLSFMAIEELLELFSEEDLWQNQPNFLKFLVSNCIHQPQLQPSNEEFPYFEAPSLATFMTVSTFLVSQFKDHWKDGKSPLPNLCLETYLQLTESCQRSHPEGVLNLLMLWVDEEEKDETSLLDFMESVMAFLVAVTKEKMVKEAISLICLLQLGLNQLSPKEFRQYAALEPEEGSTHFTALLQMGNIPPPLTKSYVGFLRRLFGNSLGLLDQVISEFKRVHGGIYEGPEEDLEEIFPMIEEKNTVTFVNGVTECLDGIIDEADFICGFVNDDEDDGGVVHQTEICDQMIVIARDLRKLSVSGIPSLEPILRVSIKFYKVLHKFCKRIMDQTKPEKLPILIQHSSKLKYQLKEFVVYSSNALSHTEARIKKESHLAPNLVFMIEQYEAVVVRLAKKMKTVDLLDLMEKVRPIDFELRQNRKRESRESDDDLESDVPTKRSRK